MITQTCFTVENANLNQKANKESGDSFLRGGAVDRILFDLRWKKKLLSVSLRERREVKWREINHKDM